VGGRPGGLVDRPAVRGRPGAGRPEHPGLITDPARLDRVLQTVIDNSATDNVTVADLMDLALSIKGNESSAIHDYTLPTVPDTDTDGLVAAATMPAYLDALVADRPLPGAAGR
jgi:hypothetical protein